MNENNDFFIYMMANEKLVSMIATVDQTMEFLSEYKVKPDDEVRKAMLPLIKQMTDWIK